ncbi:MAG: tetraacyldisaccharide 4'-kinase [Thermoguttaceae bacterium]|nr:tetraacyldisaccharide 4'-kinase [Thermoguttaceae bacterium]
MTAEDFRAIVSGQRRTPGALVARALLRAVSIPYGAAVRARNFLYDHHLFRRHTLARAVISVGNITLGGTGKSPMIAYLADAFVRRGRRAAILSRGYGAERPDRVNDEAAELYERFPAVPHYQAIDRVGAGRRLLEEHPETEILLLDDGFQYRRLERTVDLVLIDATEPFGGGAIFPRGFLREPPTSLGRAEIVILTRTDLILPEEIETLRRKIRQYAPGALLCEAAHVPAALVEIAPDGRFARRALEEPGTALAPYRHDCFLFCGIGNPAGFSRTARRLGIEPVGTRFFPDHFPYTQEDINHLTEKAAAAGARRLLTTMKDLVKLRRLSFPLPCAALEINIRFRRGERELWERLSLIASGNPSN